MVRINVDLETFNKIKSGELSVIEKKSSEYWDNCFGTKRDSVKITNGGKNSCAYMIMECLSINLTKEDVYNVFLGKITEQRGAIKKEDSLTKILGFLKEERPETFRLLKEKGLC